MNQIVLTDQLGRGQNAIELSSDESYAVAYNFNDIKLMNVEFIDKFVKSKYNLTNEEYNVKLFKSGKGI